ncbi:hypothetical protein BGW36DRAFT_385171 [Talaromyces proteolyticus]|uniref:Uncharacterized protein n=1 Tax=Talaromyces proteolyticus TaxID=1131652 RepID=A0AAD4KMU1_9EURO|nr:uncharacterized protein BGW36DRAFT_385171 [Talaromyces proteolyticus]KAH8692800.1 hypothetical protein BGW36DRAFT_385171 [Talaromyces proteolyticus]
MKLSLNISALFLSALLQSASASSAHNHTKPLPSSYYHDKIKGAVAPYNLCDDCGCPDDDYYVNGNCGLFAGDSDYGGLPGIWAASVPAAWAQEFGPIGRDNPLCGAVMHMTAPNGQTVKIAIANAGDAFIDKRDADKSPGDYGYWTVCFGLIEQFGGSVDTSAINVTWTLIANETVGNKTLS